MTKSSGRLLSLVPQSSAANSKYKKCLWPRLLNSQLPNVQQLLVGLEKRRLWSLPVTQEGTDRNGCLP